MKDNDQGITGTKSVYIANMFFLLGILGGIGLRVVLLVNKVSALWAVVIWYSANIIYLIFYSYRLYIEQRRRRIVIESGLKEKIIRGELLTEVDREKLLQIINSTIISKWRWNLIILILLSIITLIAQIIVDLL